MNDTDNEEGVPQTEASYFSCSTCEKMSDNTVKSSGAEEGIKSSCSECGRKSTRSFNAAQEKKKSHKSSAPGKKKRKKTSKYYQPCYCDICGKRFANQNNLSTHQRIHTGEKDYSCDICGRAFTYKSVLTSHLRVHTGEKNFECHVCQWKFSHKCNLKSHLKTHFREEHKLEKTDDKDLLNITPSDGNNYFPCEQCGKIFKSNKGRNQHRKVHINNIYDDDFFKYIVQEAIPVGGKFQCRLCTKTFCRFVSAKEHATFHARYGNGHSEFDGKFHNCEYCGKKFRSLNHLKVHITIHTGEREFLCDRCGKKFSQNSHLRTHAQCHSGEEYTCEVCGKIFYYKNSLVVHRKIHDKEEEGFYCKVCQKHFTKKASLIAHAKTHAERNSLEDCQVKDSQEHFENNTEEIIQELHRNKALLGQNQQHDKELGGFKENLQEDIYSETLTNKLKVETESCQPVCEARLSSDVMLDPSSCEVKSEEFSEDSQGLESDNPDSMGCRDPLDTVDTDLHI